MRAQHKYHVDQVAKLQSTATTIIQLSLFAVAAGLAAVASFPVSFAVVPPLVSVWLYYLLAIDRETTKHVVYREWLEDHLNSYYDPGTDASTKRLAPYQWQGVVEFRTSYSIPWMIYGLYSLVATAYVVGWASAAWVLQDNLQSETAKEYIGERWDDVIWVVYCIIGVMIAVFIGFGRRTTTQLRDAVSKELYADYEVPGSSKSAYGQRRDGSTDDVPRPGLRNLYGLVKGSSATAGGGP